MIPTDCHDRAARRFARAWRYAARDVAHSFRGWRPILEERDRLPLLITGVPGVQGFAAHAFFSTKYAGRVIGQRPRASWRLVAPGIVSCDLEDVDGLRRLVDAHQFRSVLQCGGSCALKPCELNPSLARRVNVTAVQSLLAALAGRSVRLVHVSIDLVFSGARGGDYAETDPVDPVTVYGRTMAEAESIVRSERPDACILRITLPMGVSFNGHAGAIDWIRSRFAAGRPATLYFDEVRSPAYVDCLNDVFEDVLASDLAGVYHAGGPRRLTLFEIAQVINRVGGFDPELLRGCYRIEAGPVPPRAGDVSVDSTRLARALGRVPFQPWPLDDEFVPTDRQWHWRREEDASDWTGSHHLLAERLYRRPSYRGRGRP
jgi:dTDP-4-dehydrorhamnose reductase